MAGGKETPRQKMIGMMYLVLTALLALNVSADILKAFLNVNDGLEITNKNMLKKNAQNYTMFENQFKIAPEKVKDAWNKAQEAQKLSKAMIQYINDLKVKLVIATEKLDGAKADEVKKPDWKLSNVASKDNYDIPTRILIGDDQVNGKGAEASKLREEIEKYKENMLKLVQDKYREKVKAGFGLDTKGPFLNYDGKEESWEMHTFYHLVILACYCQLNQMIAEIQNIEYDVVSNLYQSVSADDFKFDKIVAKVVPKSNYVVSGDSYEADIFVAAYDSKQSPEILVGSAVDTINFKIIGASETLKVENGMGKYKVGAGGSGERTYAGLINVKNPNSGEVKSYPFRSSYTVAPPSSTVSADKMNVFYSGIQNPISISVAGASADKVMANATGATLSKTGAGKWNVMVTSGAKEVVITASANVGGTNRGAGSTKFRVKSLPNPEPFIVGIPAGATSVSKNTLAAVGEVKAVLKDFLFDGVNYNVISYNVSGGQPYFDAPCTGTKFSQAAKDGIRASKPSKVTIDNIRVVAPDGSKRTLSTSTTIKIVN